MTQLISVKLSGVPAVAQVRCDSGLVVSLLLQPQRVLREGVDAETQRHEAGLAKLVEEGPVALLVHAQLSGQLHVQLTADDLVADLEDPLRHAVEIALVEHEQVTALVDEPLELVENAGAERIRQ